MMTSTATGLVAVAMRAGLSALLWFTLAAAQATSREEPPAAQSPRLKLHGTLDLALLVRHSSGTRDLQVVDGENQASRLVVEASEAIGVGKYVAVVLESAITADVGAGGDWRRRSTIGWTDGRWGEWRFGRDTVPTYSIISDHSPFGTTGIGSAGNLMYGFDGRSSTTSTLVRADNLIAFRHKATAEVAADVHLACTLREGSPERYCGLQLAYRRLDNPWTPSLAASRSRNPDGSGPFASSSLGVMYEPRGFKVQGLVVRSQQASRRQTSWMVGLAEDVDCSPWCFRGSVIYARHEASVGFDAHTATQWAAGVVRSLSKGTKTYLTAAVLRNSRAGTFSLPNGRRASFGGGGQGVEWGMTLEF